jgi:DNA-binding NarL/FixJ family response regulator
VFGEYPAVITVLVTISLILVAFYFTANRRKIESLMNQIIEESNIKPDQFENLLEKLTDRQRDVYELIVAGKTNKEIMSELFIEQSTLKTHINQIYKKLKISSRRELRKKSNP